MKESRIAVCIALTLAAVTCLLTSFPTFAEEAGTFRISELEAFEGCTIESITIHGLSRTSETAVRYLLGGKESEAFSGEKWVYGLKKLYNTNALYDLHTEIREKNQKIHIDLFLREKWTLLPYATIRGSGDSTLAKGGVFDVNLGGHFTNASVGVSNFNGSYGYDFSLYQEWFRDTDWMFGFDMTRAGHPVALQNTEGQVTQSFTWARSRQQILLGRRIGNDIRAFSYLELLEDSLVEKDANTMASVFPQTQYRIRPTLIIGRSNLTNYLQEGHEFKLAPAATNFFDSSSSYYQVSASIKWITIVGGNSNFGFYGSLGTMTSAPIPYQFRLGGFDSIRGFPTNRYIGTTYAYTNFEYRPTLFSHRFSWSLLDLVALQGCLFTDWGWLLGSNETTGLAPATASLVLGSVGAGFRLIFARYSNSIIRFDLAKTITPSEGYGMSFGIGQFF